MFYMILQFANTGVIKIQKWYNNYLAKLQNLFKMQITNDKKQLWIGKLKSDFVPHFDFLASEVRTDIEKVLNTMCDHPTKEALQKISRQGLLEEAPLLRAHLWKLLLQTLPMDPEKWEETKIHNFILYKSLVQRFLGTYLDEQDLLDLGTSNYKFDENLWNQIQLDTKRTHSTLNFFQKENGHIKMFLNKKTKNHDIMSRILYIWGKINPTVRYVQGMNEILAPLYYLQFQKLDKYSQSEAFFMFASIMSFVIDMHIKEMDQSVEGIMGKMKILNDFLKVVDYNLWQKLNSEGVFPQYYSFRWLTLLLAQQFGLCETMTLWDVLLSYEGYKRYFYLYSCCVAILKVRKHELMQGDFIAILPLLQKLRNIEVHQVIKFANKIYDKFSKINIEKLAQKIEEQKKIQHQKQKHVEQQIKDKTWNYTNILKNTTNFLYKWMPNQEKQLASQKKQ